MKKIRILFSFLAIFIASSKCYGSMVPGEQNEYQKTIAKAADFIVKEVNRDNIRGFLRYLTQRPHMAGTPAEWENAEWVASTWRNQGLDEVHLTPYEVLLSYPDFDRPNYAKIFDESDSEIWKSQGRTPPLRTEGEASTNEIPPDFNAYSKSGNIKGDIVFVNYGRVEDFDELASIGVSISGCIAIAKYGEMFRANIARNAELRGAVGLLLYNDPQHFAPEGVNFTYPDSIYMPSTAAAAGTVLLSDGDPLTPYYPAIESAFRIPEDEADIPKIPVMPLSYNDAFQILREMKGEVAPKEWQGGLNITYKLGPGLENTGWKISMEVNTYNERTTTYNVIGIIKGKIEPDRYVLLGNHRDAWIYGAIDPSSGTAAMLELSRTLQEYRNSTGWAPSRSIVFCSWGAEEYGLVGSTEWVQQFGKQLADRAVAYINLDMAIEGNYTLRTKSTPLLYEASREVTKLIPNPDPEEVKAGRLTVFDTWLLRKPDSKHPGNPIMAGVGSGSDYKSFQHNLGVPSQEYRYTHPESLKDEPLYHTAYETFFLVSELYDKNFDFHASMTQMCGILAVLISDSQILPFSLEEYASFITENQKQFLEKNEKVLRTKKINTEYFVNASNHFSLSVEAFKREIANMDLTNPLAVRYINDQLMMVERAFIDPQGLPGRPDYNHVLAAPSASDSYASATFSGLYDALLGIENLPEEDQKAKWREFEGHFAAVTYLIETAAKVLTDDLW